MSRLIPVPARGFFSKIRSGWTHEITTPARMPVTSKMNTIQQPIFVVDSAASVADPKASVVVSVAELMASVVASVAEPRASVVASIASPVFSAIVEINSPNRLKKPQMITSPNISKIISKNISTIASTSN